MQVFHTYTAYTRGLDLLLGTYNWLDLTALGRQEDWEQPRGRSNSPFMAWLRHHDRYGDAAEPPSTPEARMKFLCLISAETLMEWMTESEAATHCEEYRDFTASLRREGRLIDCNRLLPPDAAITVRVRGGKVSTTDGPFVETKEHLGGYYVIEARDLNEAIQVAARIPGARIGCVEVRPIAQDERTLRALGG